MDDMDNPPRGLKKGTGVTPAERYLKTLCDGTFLSLWSFPAIYRDQGAGQGLEKEVCDLLVVFGNHALIFSDKACAFPKHDDVAVAWKRWFRTAIVKSARQAWGAERWIREHPNRLFIDAACTRRFPFPLPAPENAVFHLIVVAHHVSQACARHLGGSGSLMIRSDLRGIDAHIANAPPFTVGDLEPAKTFVHILDDTSIHALMRTLDTVSDFVAYLSRKEKLLRGEVPVWSPGDEELLSMYLKRTGPDGQHDFVLPPGCTEIVLAEGMWEGFCRNPRRLAQIEADRISYSWDKLIEKFSHHAVTDTQHFSIPQGVEVTEKILRFMAAESRTRRRALAINIHHMLATTPIHMQRNRVDLPSTSGNPYYVFLLVPRTNDLSYEQYRLLRRDFLSACCQITKYLYPAAVDIVGIATETGYDEDNRSEDVMYLDAREWTEEQNDEARRLQEVTGFFTKTTKIEYHVDEYPDQPQQHMMRVGRNDPCPCGSGRKYKKCHGNPALPPDPSGNLPFGHPLPR